MTGIDKGPEHLSHPAPVLDAEFRRTAQTFTTPSMSRFVHGMLMLTLVEMEGLMDDMTDWNHAMLNTVHTSLLFETERKIRVSELARVQETRFLKFCVAAGIYGLPDADDEKITARLRQAREELY